MIAPTGNSRGAIAVRAIVSAKTTNIAPTIAENGTTKRLSLPTVSRTRCGTINPTNTAAPPSATAAAVSVAVQINAQRRTNATSTPSAMCRMW